MTSKSDPCTESADVNEVGISVKGKRLTRGDLVMCLRLRAKVELGTHGTIERVPHGNSRPKVFNWELLW